MDLNPADLIAELDKGVAEADTFADMVDKYADVAAKFVAAVAPASVSVETAKAVGLLDTGTRILDELKTALAAAG